MTAAENIKFFFSQLTGRLYVPAEVMNTGEKKVLHLSDTPTSLYSAIFHLVASIKPDIIIHTGDLADDIKLQHNPGSRHVYERMVGQFISSLEESTAEKIYIVPGNHDDVGIIKRCAKFSQLLTEGDTVLINNLAFGLAHYMKRLPKNAQYNLYGHNFRRPEEKEGKIYLNGICNINLLLLPSGRVVKIPYPWGTNRERGMRSALPNTI